MFRTIERRLAVLTLLLVATTGASAWLLAEKQLLLGVTAAGAALWLVDALRKGYKKFNSNVIFLLNALENGDYSFSFSAADVSRERRDVNATLNAIKEILARARETEIENEKFLSLIVAAVPVGIVIVDERDFVRVANEAALRLLGMHVFTHLKQLAMVDETVFEAFRDLKPAHRKTIKVADEREERLISLGMSRIATSREKLRVVTMTNIAGELEEREMESFTSLIRVMTHEIMNSIAPITSLSETMADAWVGDSEKRDGLDEAERLRRNTVDAFGTIGATSRRLQSFVESYRRFTGIPRPELREVLLKPFVEKVVRLLGEGVQIKTSFADPSIAVQADEGQVGQVLVNLLKNAAEAAPRRIEIRVGGGNGHSGPAYAAQAGEVCIEVSNDGAPIPPEVLPQIFVPFFTTKPSGTGIGLSVSRHIMRLHGGNLKHRTEAGKTIFTMTFRTDIR